MKYLVSLLLLISASNIFAGNKISISNIQYENYIFKDNRRVYSKIVYFDLVVDEFTPNPNNELYLAAHVKKDFLEHWMICNVFIYRGNDKKRENELKNRIVGYSGLLGMQTRLHNNHFIDFYFSDKNIKSGSKYQLIILICPKLTEEKKLEYVFDKTPMKDLDSLIKKDMIIIKPHCWKIQINEK